MPRYARCVIANVTYHIIHRGNNKQAIFFCDDDYQYFLEKISEGKKKYRVKIYSYVLMSNHIHLLIEPKITEDLGKFMKFIAQMYTQYMNYFYGRTGTLWEGRYKSSPVSVDNYLLACSRYIEMNPVRAGLVSGPKDYRWSSYCGKIGLKEDKILDFDIWYNSLGDNDLERQNKYQEWFKESIPEYEWKLIRECVNKGGIFGNEKFKGQIEESVGRKMEIRKKGRPKKEGEK